MTDQVGQGDGRTVTPRSTSHPSWYLPRSAAHRLVQTPGQLPGAGTQLRETLAFLLRQQSELGYKENSVRELAK